MKKHGFITTTLLLAHSLAYPQISAITTGPLLQTLTLNNVDLFSNTTTLQTLTKHHTRPKVKHPWPFSQNKFSVVTVHITQTVTNAILGTVTVHVKQTITRTIWESEVTSTQSLNSLKSLVVGESSISHEDMGGNSTTSSLDLSSSTKVISVHVTRTFTHTIWKSELVTPTESPSQQQSSFSLKSFVVGEDIGGDSTTFLSSISSTTSTFASSSPYSEPDITSESSTVLLTLNSSSSSEPTSSSIAVSSMNSSSSTSTPPMSTFMTMQINANKELGNNGGQTLVVTPFLPPP